ncbi:unnamed protein product [Tilletia caries]|uniref:Uncharacterized protein n=1 Tax=Tilletia caries TaxID=13290 RepID=A0ABN7J279_9BASI|nr:unnamed protein product [Tilletia caries]CAD7065967.1 unnamed protein product [Tilletia caries]
MVRARCAKLDGLTFALTSPEAFVRELLFAPITLPSFVPPGSAPKTPLHVSQDQLARLGTLLTNQLKLDDSSSSSGSIANRNKNKHSSARNIKDVIRTTYNKKKEEKGSRLSFSEPYRRVKKQTRSGTRRSMLLMTAIHNASRTLEQSTVQMRNPNHPLGSSRRV